MTSNSYDPDFGQWDFGKISALQEIALAEEGGYQHYYMGKLPGGFKKKSVHLLSKGYYIHSCMKMRYKGTFSPSYLLGKFSGFLGDCVLIDPRSRKS